MTFFCLFVCQLLSTPSSLLNLLKMKPQEQMFFKDPINIIHTRLERIAQVCIVRFFCVQTCSLKASSNFISWGIKVPVNFDVATAICSELLRGHY